MLLAKTIVAAVLLLTLGSATLVRNAAWRTLLVMWQDCAAKSPDKSRTRNNLGNCYWLQGNHFSALREYEKAVALAPGNLEAQFNLGRAYDTVGLFTQAMRPYDVFCRHAPDAFREQRERACRRLEDLLAAAGGRAAPRGGAP